MKTTIPVLLAVGCLGTAVGLPQTNGPLQIQWQKSFGGIGNDFLKTAVATSDGGYLLVGASKSPASLSPNQGNKTSPVYGGDRDFWVVRVDAEGNKLWDASFGGTAWESPMDAVELSDGGWLLAGYSVSQVGGTKTSPNHGSPGSADNGYMDFWIVRIDKDGKQLWDKAIGSTLLDRCDAILSVEADGGFLLGGYSKGGVSGDRTTPSRGQYDYWLVRVDASGNPLWDKAFGGTGIDLCYGALRTADGGAILLGSSDSPANGDRTSPSYGGGDAWVVRLDPGGNKLRDRVYGGSGWDGAVDAVPMDDGGFLLALASASAPGSGGGNKTSPFIGTLDAWLVRVDANGSALWERSFGGTGYECVYQTLTMPDGGFLAVCNSKSRAGGNKTAPNFGGYDLWLVRMDATGNKLWDQSFGGSGAETNDDDDSTPNYPGVILTSDGGALLWGTSASPPSGNKTSPLFGGKDFWILKLGPEPPFLRVRKMQPQGLPLTIIAPPNCNYLIQCSSACSGNASDWTDLATVANPTGLVEWVDTEAASVPRRFYRGVRRLPNLQ